MEYARHGNTATVVLACVAVLTLFFSIYDRDKKQNIVEVTVTKLNISDKPGPSTKKTSNKSDVTSEEIVTNTQTDGEKRRSEKNNTGTGTLTKNNSRNIPNPQDNLVLLNRTVPSADSRSSPPVDETIDIIGAHEPVDETVNFKLTNKESKHIAKVKASVSVLFENQFGRDFAKLTILPLGKKSLSLPLLGSGQQLEFESKSGEYVATVLTIDFDNQMLEVNISRID